MENVDALKSKFYFKLFLLVLVCLFLPVASYMLFKEGNHVGGYICLFSVILISPDIFIQLFSMPVSVHIENGQITSGYFGSASKIASIEEVSGYSTIRYATRGGGKKGVILYLKNGSKIAITDFNLSSITAVKDYLESAAVKHFGEDSSYPWFIIRKYKYNNLVYD